MFEQKTIPVDKIFVERYKDETNMKRIWPESIGRICAPNYGCVVLTEKNSTDNHLFMMTSYADSNTSS